MDYLGILLNVQDIDLNYFGKGFLLLPFSSRGKQLFFLHHLAAKSPLCPVVVSEGGSAEPNLRILVEGPPLCPCNS